jgi:hypothetical protein
MARQSRKPAMSKNFEAPFITSRWANRKRSQALLNWLAKDSYDLALTITLNRNNRGKAPSLESARKSFRRIFIDLERSIYGNRCRRKGSRLKRIAFLGRGILNDNPHIHMAVQRPSGMDIKTFKSRVINFLLKEKLAGIFKVEEIWDTGWIDYMTHHGVETFETTMSSFAASTES